MSDEELKNFYTRPLVLNISSNSVLTERAIRTDNEVASMSTSANIREGMVRAIMQDRKSKPKLESMSDVVGLLFDIGVEIGLCELIANKREIL